MTRSLAIYAAKIINSVVFITLGKDRFLGLHDQWLFIMQMRVLSGDRTAVKQTCGNSVVLVLTDLIKVIVSFRVLLEKHLEFGHNF